MQREAPVWHVTPGSRPYKETPPFTASPDATLDLVAWLRPGRPYAYFSHWGDAGPTGIVSRYPQKTLQMMDGCRAHGATVPLAMLAAMFKAMELEEF